MTTRDNDPRLTGAATPLTLEGDDGETIELSTRPLTDRDMDELDAWLRREYVARLEAATEGASESMRRDVMIHVASTVPSVHFMDAGIGSRMIASPVGLARLIWQSCRRDQPDLKFARLKSMLIRVDNRKKARRHWEDQNIGPSSSPGKEGSEAGGDESAEPTSTED